MVQVKKQRMCMQLTQTYLIMSCCDTNDTWFKNNEKSKIYKGKNDSQPTRMDQWIPANTRNTMVWVRGVSQCFKIQNCTHFGNTVGLTVPMLNANQGGGGSPPQWQAHHSNGSGATTLTMTVAAGAAPPTTPQAELLKPFR